MMTTIDEKDTEHYLVYASTNKRVPSTGIYANLRAAKSVLTKINKRQMRYGLAPIGDAVPMSVTKYKFLWDGHTRTVRNLLTGIEVEIPVDTPLHCDPSSETYHSM